MTAEDNHADKRRALRLDRINKKGWEVAQRLMKVKSRQDVRLADLAGLRMDDTTESPETRLRRWLDQINAARQSLGTADFGRCGSCAGAIGEVELDEQPWADICAACARG
ncbi:MAG: RNA polymerase-binding transcription factor DksA [Myxococcota bacterium]|jgi:RNA polymerase-binding transcription factor DksA